MKALLPHSKQFQEYLKVQHHYAVQKLKSVSYPVKEYYEDVNNLMDTIMSYDTVKLYNKYATNKCRFGYGEDTKECCEKKFNQTLRHFTIHGNCCQSCSNYFNFAVKAKEPCNTK